MTDHFDMIIAGAGISGIGAAVHMKDKCPNKTVCILEAREALGGTWDLFKYPGIRSDSDMHTLGYNFKPWTNAKAIADGPAILSYLKETVQEHDLVDKIRCNHKITQAHWDTETALWHVTAQVGSETKTLTCNFLFMCSGYYKYTQAYRPHFEGEETFKGQIIHPQFWTEDTDYTDKKVVIIGSGATAVTLFPSLTDKAEYVTMLQRSPGYLAILPAKDMIANALRKILPAKLAYKIAREKNILRTNLIYSLSRTNPEKAKKLINKQILKIMGKKYDLSTHFKPRYNPWDERLCLVPDGDFFDALKADKGQVVTDHIERFDKNGIILKSGERLDADLIITATGLDLEILGGAEFFVDGEAVDFSKTYSYEAMMYSDVPNMASVFGYINASWTLRADLIAEYVCRIVNHMDKSDTNIAVPRAPEGMTSSPWIDFQSGYMQRAMHLMPMQGDRDPWRNDQSHGRDRKHLPTKPVDDGAMIFSKAKKTAIAAE